MNTNSKHSFNRTRNDPHPPSPAPVPPTNTNLTAGVPDRHDCNTLDDTIHVSHDRMSVVLYFLSSLFIGFHTFGIHRLLARAFAYQPPRHLEVEATHSPWAPMMANHAYENDMPDISALELSEHRQWYSVLKIMAGQWTDTCKGCVLVLYLSLGLLQINDANGNIYSRTTVIAAFMCSGIGLMSGVVFLYADAYFKAETFRARWVSASKYVRTNSANNFWACLSLPISLLAWSIFFLVLSVMITICISPVLKVTTRDSGTFDHPELSWVLSMVFLLTLALGQGVQVYRSMKLLLA